MSISALGRLRSGPEREMIDEYLSRATATGRAVGMGPAGEVQIDNRNLKTRADESRAMRDSLPADARLVLLDERGRSMPARQLASTLGQWRDEGIRETVFCIGGADGHDHDILPRPHLMLAFGNTVWPHKLVRIMLAEQIYRAVSILAGSPYHRD